MKIRIGNKEFEVKVSESDEESRIGLTSTNKLKKGTGFAMQFDGTRSIPITMQGMAFPIDIIFTLDSKVTKVVKNAKPNQKDIDIEIPSNLIIEVNAGESDGISKNDEVSLIGKKNEDGTVEMVPGGITVIGNRQVLDADGKNQMNLIGGERIFSRKATAKIVELSKNKEYKKLGKFAIEEIRKQDERPPEYSKN